MPRSAAPQPKEHVTPQVADLYAQLGIELQHTGGPEAPTRCFAAPEHHADDDRHPSASVNLNTGAWICHACGARGGAYDAARAQGHTPRSAMALLITHGLAQPRDPDRLPQTQPVNQPPPTRRAPQPTQSPVTTHDVDTFHRQLLDEPSLTRRLAVERGISPATIAIFALGYHRGRITMPISNPHGRITGLLRWQPFERGTGSKMLAHPGTRRELFPPPETITAQQLLICEGEPDALAAHSAGIPAVAIPGIASWRPAWARRFTGHTITIALDCDLAGRQCAQHVVQDLQAAGITAAAIDLAPNRSDGYDLTDHLLSKPGTPVLP